MKTLSSPLKNFSILLIGFLTLMISSLATAYPNGSRGVPNHGSSSAFLLEQAYAKLEAADHDYNGHRVHAMELIKKAVYRIGGSINPNGAGGHEAQTTSDDQLKAAREILTNARVQLERNPLHWVDDAIAEIDTALSIK
jgi:hypothetical protein